MKRIAIWVLVITFIIFAVLALAGVIYVLSNRGEANAGYALIPTSFGLVFSMLFEQTKRKMDDYKE